MVKMVLSSSDAQGQTMSSVGKARIDAYNSAVKALSNFNGAGDLQGSAYDSGKKYGVSVITPLIKGAIMYSEYLSEAVPKLPSKYRSEVGDEDLDSAVLESEIQSLESSISSLRGSLRAMEGSDHADKSLLQNISSRMDGLTSQKNEKMDKLRKLNLFAGSSNEVFEGDAKKSMDTVVKNLASGLNMIQGDFASFGGTFPKHSGKTLNWAKSIEGEWDKKAKIDEDYQKVLEKANKGKELSDDDVKKINAYKSRYSNRELPENIQQKIDAYNEKKKKEIERNKKLSEAKSKLKDSINNVQIFGYEHTVSIEQTQNIQGRNFTHSTYTKVKAKSVIEKKGFINLKTNNGKISGVGIDLKFISFEIGVEDWHINAKAEVSAFGYKGGIKTDLGISEDHGLELDVAAGVGKTKGNKTTTNYYGLKLSTDINDGILAGYHQQTESEKKGDRTNSKEIESGIQIGNTWQVALVGLGIMTVVQPESSPYTIPWMGKVISGAR